MNGLFFVLAANVLALGSSVLFEVEYHEAAAVVALNLTALAFFIAVVCASDVIKIIRIIKEETKKDE